MPVPTRVVTFRVFESDGTPIAGAPVKARMTGTDVYQLQFVDRVEEQTVTDAQGIAHLNLFPNVLGERGTAYVFTIRNPLTNRKILQTVGKVPDNDSELTDIMCNVCGPDDPTPGFSGTGNGIVVKIKGLYGVRLIYSSDGIEIVNPGGQDGDIGVVLDDDLEAIEALEGFGVPERYGPNLWRQFPITQFGKDLVNLPGWDALPEFFGYLLKSGGTMTGPLYLYNDPMMPMEAANKNYVDLQAQILRDYINSQDQNLQAQIDALGPGGAQADQILQQNIDALAIHVDQADALLQANIDAGLASKVNRTGDAMLGYLTLFGPPINPLDAVTKAYVDQSAGGSTAYIDAQDNKRVLKAGDTMTGTLILSGDPVNNLDAVTKQYADTHGGGVTIQDTEPQLLKGREWFESDTGQMYLKYQNPDSTFTLVAINGSGPKGDPGDPGMPGPPGPAGTPPIPVACSDEITALTAGAAKVTFRMGGAMTLTKIKASLTTASTSGLVTVDVNRNGTSLFSTRLTIDVNEKTSKTAATPAVLVATALAEDDEITIDLDAAGTNAKGLKVYLV